MVGWSGGRGPADRRSGGQRPYKALIRGPAPGGRRVRL